MGTDQLGELRQSALAQLLAASTLDDLATWHVQFLGRKGALTDSMRMLGSISAEQRPAFGKALNALKLELSSAFEEQQESVRGAQLNARLASESIDVTLPGRPVKLGTLHPLTQMTREVSSIFAHLGFQTVEGPEVEDAYYAFDALNIPKDHPARDVWDTIFVRSKSREIVLRPHTSPMQVRTMERLQPPVRVIVPGRCYRYEALDATHEWHFQQVEGLAVDEHITMTDLKGTLAEFARQLFGKERKVRFRCDYFPFVEPGVDFAIDCMVCHGSGCRVCKGSGWIEILGAGMVHPHVLANVGYDPDRYTGFAFGCGIERLTMLKYGITDIRAFYQSDLRFLSQFNHASA
ncbi:MAG TPA: phenylalanine--tRNA ligase subunit alpha [Nitrolancea sp.]|nr:phenylalanine--tRNA ligase subunit alpha [Nitrolancea sp.]